MSKAKVLLAEELSPATIDALGPDFDVLHCNGADVAELHENIADVDAILIRSATQMDEAAIKAAKNLKVIARAGVGIDNVDVAAATQAGVMVVNAPTSNITSAAELTIGHILSLARHIPAAHSDLQNGTWNRQKYTGTELLEKTLGIIGLGRIGALIVERLRPFGMEFIAYDPYVSDARAAQLGVEMVSLEELYKRADFITVHMPKTKETTGMINTAAFAMMKPTTRVINVARGGIIDEDDLLQALNDETIAGASLDVFNSEPPEPSELLSHPRVIVTPHLGASTEEAQEKAGVAVAKSVRRALAGDLVPDAVNVAGGEIHEVVRPHIMLTEKLGQIITAVSRAPLTSLKITVAGELAQHDAKVLELAALKGIFKNVITDQVSYVNAPVLAEDRNIAIEIEKNEASEDHASTVTLSAGFEANNTLTVTGALTGSKQVEKLIRINTFDLEIPLSTYMLYLNYTDQAGIVGTMGQLLGAAEINIANMQVSRQKEGGNALCVLSIDNEAPDALVADLEKGINAERIVMVTLKD